MALRNIIFEENPKNKYEIAILIKDTCFNETEILKYYVEPLVDEGVAKNNIIVFNLAYTNANKAPASLINAYLPQVLSSAKQMGVTTLLVADTNYFKKLTKVTKTEPYYGHVEKCKFPKYEDFNVILSLNYASLFYDPTQQVKIDRSIKCIVDQLKGFVIKPGAGIIHSAQYYTEPGEIQNALANLHKYPALTIDIETSDLTFYTANLYTIAFAWDEHNGICIKLKKSEFEYLKQFFIDYKGKKIFHNATFDIKILIYNLFMDQDRNNKQGLIDGLNIMYKNTDCTQLISYLATNTTAGNKLSLKYLASEFAGNYALDINGLVNWLDAYDVKTVMEYNLVDCLSTWYVYNKYYPKLVEDQQEYTYKTIYQPTMKTVTYMELVGMPINPDVLDETATTINIVLEEQENILTKIKIIAEFEKVMRLDRLIEKQSKLKVKKITIEDIEQPTFNPNSNKQVGQLLHDHMQLPVIDKTPTGAPAVGTKSLKKLKNKLISEYNITDEDLK